MSALDPRHAAAQAEAVIKFLSSFKGQNFSDAPVQSFDRQHLGAALDWLEEMSAMVLSLATCAPPAAGRSVRAVLDEPYNVGKAGDFGRDEIVVSVAKIRAALEGLA